MLLGWLDEGFVDFMSPSRSFGRSARKILNRRGLSIHPCFTPKLTPNESVTLSPYLIQILSLVYIFFMILKNFPSIPWARSFCNSVSRGIVSKALLKSIKQEYSHFLLIWHCFCTRLCIIMWASDVLLPGTNPSCGSERIFFFNTKVQESFFMTSFFG